MFDVVPLGMQLVSAVEGLTTAVAAPWADMLVLLAADRLVQLVADRLVLLAVGRLVLVQLAVGRIALVQLAVGRLVLVQLVVGRLVLVSPGQLGSSGSLAAVVPVVAGTVGSAAQASVFSLSPPLSQEHGQGLCLQRPESPFSFDIVGKE